MILSALQRLAMALLAASAQVQSASAAPLSNLLRTIQLPAILKPL
jgi:hypothetical protein